MKRQKNQQKRTLKAFLENIKRWWQNASREERNEAAVAAAVTVFMVALFVGFGVILTTPTDYGPQEILTTYTPAERPQESVQGDATAEPERPSPTHLAASDDNAFYNARFAATETYSYQSISDIPREFPDDCRVLRFRVDYPSTGAKPGTVFRDFKNDTLGYQFSLSRVSIEGVSAEAVRHGYPTLGVFVKDAGNELVELECFAFNPEEGPWVEIRMCGGYPPHAYVRMDVPVFECGFSSKTEPIGLSTYRSTGASYSNYAFWGAGEGGNDEYYFGKATVTLAVDEPASWCRPLEHSLENLAVYQTYWEKNRTDVMRLRECFSKDRSQFLLDYYVRRHTDVNLGYESADQFIIARNGQAMSIKKVDSEQYGESIKISINGDEISYALNYSPRVSGLTDETTLPNGMVVNREQLSIILKFLQDA